MECIFCDEVTHPTCVTDYGIDGSIRMDLPNSWECPKCLASSKNDDNPETEASPAKALKTEMIGDDMKKSISSGSDANISGYQLFSVKATSDQSKYSIRTQLAEQILAASTAETRKPKYVYRPPPLKAQWIILPIAIKNSLISSNNWQISNKKSQLSNPNSIQISKIITAAYFSAKRQLTLMNSCVWRTFYSIAKFQAKIVKYRAEMVKFKEETIKFQAEIV